MYGTPTLTAALSRAVYSAVQPIDPAALSGLSHAPLTLTSTLETPSGKAGDR